MFDLECIRIVECGDECDKRVADLEKVVEELKAGQPEIYAHLDDVRFDLRALKHHDNQRPPPPWMAAPHELTAARPPAGSTIDWPSGHHVEMTTRVRNYGSATTVAPTPTNGMFVAPNHDPHYSLHFPPPNPPPPAPNPHNSNSHHPDLGHLPKMHFPQFNGDDPQYWMTCAQNYFDMYGVHPSMWIKCSTMQFTGPARRWFQSVERNLVGVDWPSFCRMIRERFCRDQHELLLRTYLHIRQTTTVQDYVDRFVDLIE